MYGRLALVEMGFSAVLFLSAWYAVREAVRLRWSGTAERLHRKSRKLIVRTGQLTVTALVVFCCITIMVASLPSDYWKDRLMLNAPLIGAPLLAIWFSTLPMLWRLWKLAGRTEGVLDAETKQYLSSRLFVLPYQATALGAATSFYCTVVSPVPYDKLKVAVPLVIYMLVMVGLWLHHDWRHAHFRDWLRGGQNEDAAENDSLPLSEESGTRI